VIYVWLIGLFALIMKQIEIWLKIGVINRQMRDLLQKNNISLYMPRVFKRVSENDFLTKEYFITFCYLRSKQWRLVIKVMAWFYFTGFWCLIKGLFD